MNALYLYYNTRSHMPITWCNQLSMNKVKRNVMMLHWFEIIKKNNDNKMLKTSTQSHTQTHKYLYRMLKVVKFLLVFLLSV